MLVEIALPSVLPYRIGMRRRPVAALKSSTRYYTRELVGGDTWTLKPVDTVSLACCRVVHGPIWSGAMVPRLLP